MTRPKYPLRLGASWLDGGAASPQLFIAAKRWKLKVKWDRTEMDEEENAYEPRCRSPQPLLW